MFYPSYDRQPAKFGFNCMDFEARCKNRAVLPRPMLVFLLLFFSSFFFFFFFLFFFYRMTSARKHDTIDRTCDADDGRWWRGRHTLCSLTVWHTFMAGLLRSALFTELLGEGFVTDSIWRMIMMTVWRKRTIMIMILVKNLFFKEEGWGSGRKKKNRSNNSL